MITQLRIFVASLLLLLLSACGEAPVKNGQASRILAMGDSLMAWNAGTSRAIPDVVEAQLGVPVTNRSVTGARVIYALPVSGSLGLNISKQYVDGDWDWVILNGGGNDLWLGCGCGECDRKMARMISTDGTRGDIPSLVRQLRQSGAQVAYLGYLRTPGKGSPIDHCRGVGDELEARLAKMATRDPGVHYVSLKDLVPYGDLSFHAADRIHPSVKGSAAIGARVASLISKTNRKR